MATAPHTDHFHAVQATGASRKETLAEMLKGLPKTMTADEARRWMATQPPATPDECPTIRAAPDAVLDEP